MAIAESQEASVKNRKKLAESTKGEPGRAGAGGRAGSGRFIQQAERLAEGGGGGVPSHSPILFCP